MTAATIEAKHYTTDAERIAATPEATDMARAMLALMLDSGTSLADAGFLHADGSPTWGFTTAARDELARRGVQGESIGAPARGVLLAFDREHRDYWAKVMGTPAE